MGLLQRLRQHQKLLLIVAAVGTLTSIVFFGSAPSFTPASQKEAQEVGKALDGSPIFQRDVEMMSHFLSLEEGKIWKHDLLETGIATLLAEHYFDLIRPELEVRLAKAKRHPYLKGMSAEQLSSLAPRSPEEWFGPRFAQLLCRFLINASLIAQEKGYTISNEEAHGALVQAILRTLQRQSPRSDLGPLDATRHLSYHLHLAGVDEPTGITLWKRILLFHRLFEEIGQSVFLDPLTYEHFSSYAREKAKIDLYHLPPSLHLPDFRSCLKLQCYLDSVTPSPSFDLPQTFFTASKVMQNSPELIQQRYVLEVAQVTQEEIAEKITLQETWDWEREEANWAKLKETFPQLTSLPHSTPELRSHSLDQLESTLRLKVDRFARRSLVDLHPEWIEREWRDKEGKKVELLLRMKGSTPPFHTLKNPQLLRTFLETLKVGQGPALFTEDHTTFYRIALLKEGGEKEVMTFEEALSGDLIGYLLDQKLAALYSEFCKRQGEKLPFEKVKDQIGEQLYTPLLQRSHLALYMEKVKKSVQEQGDNSPYLQRSGSSLRDQWAIVKQTLDIKRSDPSALEHDKLFTSPVGEWSPLFLPTTGNLSFFYLLEKGVDQEGMENDLIKGQEALGRDAKRAFLQQIVSRT